jgi:hypothetical protein
MPQFLKVDKGVFSVDELRPTFRLVQIVRSDSQGYQAVELSNHPDPVSLGVI